MQIEIHGQQVEIQFKKMKNIYLRLKADGRLVVSAPVGTSIQYLEKFILSKLDWIESKRHKLEKEKASPCFEGEILLFGNVKPKNLTESQLQSILETKILEFIEKYWLFFSKAGCRSVDIKYRKMKSTWGVCRPTPSTITFNKKLVHQPLDFVEYVVVHELCHLLVPNHSRDFYALVAKLMPDWRVASKKRIIFKD